jgi:hypothetical protein
MPNCLAAAKIEPVAAMQSSRSAFPGPIAITAPNNTLRRGCAGTVDLFFIASTESGSSREQAEPQNHMDAQYKPVSGAGAAPGIQNGPMQ